MKTRAVSHFIIHVFITYFNAKCPSEVDQVCSGYSEGQSQLTPRDRSQTSHQISSVLSRASKWLALSERALVLLAWKNTLAVSTAMAHTRTVRFVCVKDLK